MQQPQTHHSRPQRAQPQPHASATAPTAIQELQTLTREFLECTPRPSEAAADDQREAEAEKPVLMDSADPLPRALSIAHRLCTCVLDRAPTAAEARERAQALWKTDQQQPPRGRSLVQHTLLWLDAAVTAGHQLSYLFVRLLTILVGARVAEATSELLRPLPGSQTTFLQLLSGMLRLSEAPWMLRECIELLSVLLGVDELQRVMLQARDDRSSAAEMQQSKQSRSSFVAAFLGPSGRSILSLVRHWSHEALSEETRLTLMRVVVALASTPPAAAAVVSSSATTLRMQHQQQQLLLQSASIPARRILASHREKWSESLLPPVQSASDDQSYRRAQIQCIRELAAIIEVTEPDAAATTTRSTPAAVAAALSGVGTKKTMTSRLPQSHASGASAAAAASGVPLMVSSRGSRSHDLAAASNVAAIAESSAPPPHQHWSAPVDPFAPSLSAAYPSSRR